MWWSWNRVQHHRRNGSRHPLALSGVDTGHPSCRFHIGEEVVARLDGVDVFSVDGSMTLPLALRPRWTIGQIVELRTADDRTVYVLRFRWRGQACISIVGDEAVDGLA